MIADIVSVGGLCCSQPRCLVRRRDHPELIAKAKQEGQLA